MKAIRNFLLTIFLVTLTNGQICNKEIECHSGDLITITTTSSSSRCLEDCKSTPRCQWYTFRQDLKASNCKLQASCHGVEECSTCSTGQVICSGALCDLQGLCQGPLINSTESTSSDECGELCNDSDVCSWFSYGSDTCYLFEHCPVIDENELDYITSQVECIQKPRKNKLVVAMGNPVNESITVEIIDMENPGIICQDLGTYAVKTMGAQGGVLYEAWPMFCGGYDEDHTILSDCYMVDGSSQTVGHMLEPRMNGASFQMQDSIWIIGGYTNNGGTNSSEFIYLNGTAIQGPELPLPVYDHCVAPLDDSRLLLAGGYSPQIPYHPNTTWVYDFDQENWFSGPEILLSREAHGCGSFYSDYHGSQMVAIVGGYAGSQYTNSTELIRADNLERLEGPWLPKKLCCMAVVTNPAGNGLWAIGGSSGYEYQATIYELTCPLDTGCQWKTLEQKLKVARNAHVAFLTHDNPNFDCKDETTY